jgi:hypothetical protein
MQKQYISLQSLRLCVRKIISDGAGLSLARMAGKARHTRSLLK